MSASSLILQPLKRRSFAPASAAGRPWPRRSPGTRPRSTRPAILSASERAPSLAAVADAVGVGRFHFHRVFKEVVGTTPGEYFKASGRPVTEAIYGAGYGSISRAYENARKVLGMTPAARWAGGGRNPGPVCCRRARDLAGAGGRHRRRHLRDRVRERSGRARGEIASPSACGGDRAVRCRHHDSDCDRRASS